MKKDVYNIVEDWLKNLGYTFDNSLYRIISPLSFEYPSYRIMAKIILNSIKYHNPILSDSEAWKYTTYFVDQMKSNFISNNMYFQKVLKNGFFNPENNSQENGIKLFGIKNNNFNFLRNISINNNTTSQKFDFLIIINSLPVILIKIIDNNISFEDNFSKMEYDINNFPMFFNFNKLILFTDGIIFKLGTLYDFPEEYIEFCDNKKGTYNIEILENLLSSKNVVAFLKKAKNSIQISEFIDSSLINKTHKVIHNNIKNDILIKDIVDKKDNIEEKESINLNTSFYEDDELNFLSSIFQDDLSETLNSEDFKNKLKHSKEVPDYKENKNYIKDIKTNNNSSTLDTLIRANERLVIKEVNKYITYQTSSMDADDMYQLGYIGLIKAVEKFDLSRDNEFSTYAMFWIKQSITRGINNDSLLIRLPVHRWNSLIKLSKLELESEIKFNKVNYNWISKELNLTQEQIIDLISIRNNFINNPSLDLPVEIDGDTVLGEFIEDKNNNVEDIIINKDLRDSLYKTLDLLDEKSKDIIIRRFGLNGQEPMTLEEIGKIYNLTKERIRQIEIKTLKKLKNLSGLKNLKIYCED